MAVSSVSKIEEEHTPPSTPGPRSNDLDPKSVETVGKPCAAKDCARKKRYEGPTSGQGRKKETQGHDPGTSDSDTSSDESSCDEDDTDTSDESEETLKGRQEKTKSRTKKSTGQFRGKNSSSDKQKRGKSTSNTKHGTGDDCHEKKERDQRTPDKSPGAEDINALQSQLSARGYDMTGRHNAKFLKFFLTSLSKDDGHQIEKTTRSVNVNQSDEEGRTTRRHAVSTSKVEFKRLDEFWDEDLHDYKVRETSEDAKSDKFAKYVFTVRRKFDNDGHYVETLVDIKSKPLKESLQKVMAEVESVNLLEETPHIPPNMLFLYLEDLREHLKMLKKDYKTANKRRIRESAKMNARHLRLLVAYLDEDFDETKKTLDPLLKSGRITFELLWALFKPNSIAYTSTYGDEEQPRAFKVESVYQNRSVQRGVYYDIEGQFLDFDGKNFGMSDYLTEIAAFRGTRKITSLGCYPLKFHHDADGTKTTLLEQGKKFITLAGQNYKSCIGMAFVKKKDKVLRANVNGRIMVDPRTFRRVNPNYPLYYVEPRMYEVEKEGPCCCSSTSERHTQPEKPPASVETLFRLINDDDHGVRVIEINAQEQADFEQHIDSADKEKEIKNTFSEIELMIASPVVLGFSFSEKAWLEFAVSSVNDVTWNVGAFDALVLPDNHKSIVKALVSAHSLHASKTFDDVIAGKGKGLVAVLHGRPGLGKTLTCEAVSDLLKRPLYTISAGDLGTNPAQLEAELQSILDIAHAWGAVILLDEADVFLEERSIHDVHRNALVSIFLRLLEYFQGIIFLTTNRVSTFDEAFVSRVHLSLRYGDLTFEAKRSVWKTFVEKARKADETELETISEKDYSQLARCEVNGRQIKNLVKTAHALALHEGKSLCMEHIKQVMVVARSFEMELKGGAGYSDAMRSYT